jgi:hypothetical protein
MQLDDQFPTAVAGFRSPNCFYKSSDQLDCFHCGEQTAWFHLGNVRFFCSERCYQQYVAGEKYHTRHFACETTKPFARRPASEGTVSLIAIPLSKSAAFFAAGASRTFRSVLKWHKSRKETSQWMARDALAGQGV